MNHLSSKTTFSENVYNEPPTAKTAFSENLF